MHFRSTNQPSCSPEWFGRVLGVPGAGRAGWAAAQRWRAAGRRQYPPEGWCDLTPTFFWVYFGERTVCTPGSHRAENCCTHPARLSVPGEDGEGRREEICLFFAEMLSLGEEPHPQALTSCREEQPRVCNGSASCSVGPQPA